jgi:hypothetical protein
MVHVLSRTARLGTPKSESSESDLLVIFLAGACQLGFESNRLNPGIVRGFLVIGCQERQLIQVVWSDAHAREKADRPQNANRASARQIRV